MALTSNYVKEKMDLFNYVEGTMEQPTASKAKTKLPCFRKLTTVKCVSKYNFKFQKTKKQRKKNKNKKQKNRNTKKPKKLVKKIEYPQKIN